VLGRARASATDTQVVVDAFRRRPARREPGPASDVGGRREGTGLGRERRFERSRALERQGVVPRHRHRLVHLPGPRPGARAGLPRRVARWEVELRGVAAFGVARSFTGLADDVHARIVVLGRAPRRT
jgi:hypothetical protein